MVRKAANGLGHLARKERGGKPYGNWLIRHRVPGQKSPDYVNLGTKDYNLACERYHEWIADRKRAEGNGIDPNLTFQDFIRQRYEDRVRDQARLHDVTRQTLARYKNIHLAMEAYLRANNLELLRLGDLKPEVFQGFLAWRVKQGRFHGVSKKVRISEAGANKEWRYWRGLLRGAFQNRFLSRDVTRGIKPYTLPERRTPLPTAEEIQEVLALFDPNERELVEFLAFLLNTGARPGEGMHLHWRDLDFNNKSFHIRPDDLTDWTTKTQGSWRQVPMPEVVEKLFRDIQARRQGATPADYVFLNETTRQPLHRHDDLAYKRLGKALRKANRLRLAAGREAIPKFEVRTLRSWFVTWAITRPEHPLSEVEVVKLVGHVDFTMIRKHYFKLDMTSVSAAKMRRGSALGGLTLSSMTADNPPAESSESAG